MDSNWFVESDDVYCNSSMGNHTASCWSYNVDYLIKHNSDIHETAKACIAQYGKSPREKGEKVKK